MTVTDSIHEPEPWFWEAGSDKCPHGPKPSGAASDKEDEAWAERHQPSDQDVFICLDAPAGDVCPSCSANHNESVPWSACDARAHARPRPGSAPPEGHEPVEVWVGTFDCLERECDELYDDEGDPIPGKEHCSHIGFELICGACSGTNPDGYYEPTVPWPGPHAEQVTA